MPPKMIARTRRDHDVLITVAALATTALIIVLLQGSFNIEKENIRADSQRVRRADEDGDGSVDVEWDTCPAGQVPMDLYNKGCLSIPCCEYEDGGNKGSEEEDAEELLRKKKRRKTKLTDPADIFKHFTTKHEQLLPKALKEYNKAVKSNPSMMMAAHDPEMDMNSVSSSREAFLSALETDSGVNCRMREAQVSFKTKFVCIVFPQTSDIMSMDKEAAYAEYIKFTNTIYTRVKSSGYARTKVYSAPYIMNSLKMKQMKGPINTNDKIFKFADGQSYQQPSLSKLLSKTYNTFIKRYVGTDGGQLKKQSTAAGKSCMLILLMHEIPKDYTNIMRGDYDQQFFDQSQVCTIVPVFMETAGQNPNIFNGLIPHLVPGVNDGVSYDDDMKGFYRVGNNGDAVDGSALTNVMNGCMSYMCLAETHVFCHRLYEEFVPEDDGERSVTTTAAAATSAAEIDDATTEGTEAPDVTTTEGYATEPVTYPATSSLPVDDSCCGINPYLATTFNQNEKICCPGEDGAYILKATDQTC